MRIIFFGTPDFAVNTLKKLLNDDRHEVVAVVTQPDKVRSRGRKVTPSAVKKVAVEHNLPVWQPARIKKDQETLALLEQTQADVFVVVAYGQILSTQILEMPKYGCVNVHGSILPEYRGAAPIQWSIYDGKDQTGITTMLMDKGMDTGDMLLKAYTEIDLFTDLESLSSQLANQGADLLLETLEQLASQTVTPTPQDDKLATYARLITKDDFTIDWQQSALQIHNHIRAFYPYVITTFRGENLKVMKSLPVNELDLQSLPSEYKKLPNYLQDLESLSGEIGTIVKTIKNFGFLVQTGSGLLLVLEVQLAGKKAQSAWNFINGSRLEIGEKLGE